MSRRSIHSSRERRPVSSRIRSRDAGEWRKRSASCPVKERTAASRSTSIRERNRYFRSAPRESREANRVRAGPAPSRMAADARSIAASTPTSPSIPSTSAAVTLPPPETAACSKRDCPSRIDPKAYRAMRARASSSAEIPSARAISDSRPRTSASVSMRKSNRCTRERIVSGMRLGSVVARMNTTWGGGSSSVFSSPLKACFDSMWTSSMM